MTDRTRALMKVEGVLTAILIGLLAMVYLSSCTTTKVVTVEKLRTDTLYESKLMYDSIFVHDSIHIKEAGDSVWIERWHIKYKEKLKTDTVYLSKTDSVFIKKEVTKEVPGKLTWWQNFKIKLFNYCCVAIAIALLIYFTLVYLKPFSRLQR